MRRSIAISGQESGETSREKPEALSAKDLLSRLQEIVDTKPTEGSYSLEWAVAAYFLGDLNALARLSLRSSS